MKCIHDAPKLKFGDSKKGNGFIEYGEECDCGQADCSSSTKDPCCDGATSLFKPNAECSANDPCCASCKIVAGNKTKLCRKAEGACDLDDYCDGKKR